MEMIWIDCLISVNRLNHSMFLVNVFRIRVGKTIYNL
jgi:hypothetical protein